MSAVGFLKEFLDKARNNKGYLGGVVSAYAVMGSQILLQLILVPLYLSTLGKAGFGVLMMVLAFAHFAVVGLNGLQGRGMRVLSETMIGIGPGIGKEQGAMDTIIVFRAIGMIYGIYMGLVGLALIGSFLGPWPILTPGTGLLDQMELIAVVLLGVAYLFSLGRLNVEFLMLMAAKKQVQAYSFFIMSVFLFGAGALTWLSHGGGLVAVMTVFVISNFLSYCAAVGYRQRWLQWDCPSASFALVKQKAAQLVNGEGRKYLVYGGLLALLQIDVLIVGVLGTTKMVADYVLIWKIAEVVIILLWRISESLQPEIIHMDLNKEYDRLSRVFHQGLGAVWFVALVAGIGYGIYGADLVGLWVGPDRVPDDPLSFALAGGAIVWLGTARYSSMFLYALAHMDRLILIIAVELVLKLTLIAFLFPEYGYRANLISINAVYLFGGAVLYPLVSRRVIGQLRLKS